MKRNKKAFLIVIIVVAVVLIVGTVTTTYAWLLSRYTQEYPVVLDSTSPLIIKYETDLRFGSGDTDPTAAANILVPATAKSLVGIEQEALDPLDMFDVDTVSPSHSGAVQTAAQAVSLVADGAYWTGESAIVGLFRPEFHAYTGAFLASDALQDHLSALHVSSALSENNLLSVLSLESETYTAASGNRLIARNDLFEQGEVQFAMLITYLGNTILYYDGEYYLAPAAQESTDLTLPSLLESTSALRSWHKLVDPDDHRYSDNAEEKILNGVYLRLLPNPTFSFKTYVFVAKTDEELDPAINGETLSLFASLSVLEETQQGGNS